MANRRTAASRTPNLGAIYDDTLFGGSITVDRNRRGREWLATAAGLRAGYYLLLTAFLLSWVVLSSSYRPDTRLLPIAVSVILLVGISVRVVTRLSGPASTAGPDEAHAPSNKEDTSVDGRQVAVGFAWLGGLLVLVAGIGLVPGVATFATAFTSRYEGYRRGLAVGIGTAVFVAGLFVLVLDLPGFEPYVIRLLRAGGG